MEGSDTKPIGTNTCSSNRWSFIECPGKYFVILLLTDPIKIANTFNDSIADVLQTRNHQQGKDFHNFLKNDYRHSFFIKLTDGKEIVNLINEIDSGPSRIENFILQLIKF